MPIHDLRRNFLTAAERLDVPHYALRKLANHVSASDVTAGYLVVDVERLRGFMDKISQHFLCLFEANTSHPKDCFDASVPEKREQN